MLSETTNLTYLEHKNVIVTNHCAKMKNQWLQITERTNAIPECWTELQIHCVDYTGRLREENLAEFKCYQDCRDRLFREWFFFLFSVIFHFLIWLKRKNSEMKTKTVIIFLGCLNPKEGNPGALALDCKLPEWENASLYCFMSSQ